MQEVFNKYHKFLVNLAEEDYPHWQGVFIQKNPLDLWSYAEIILKVAPDIIIETGTYRGGSAVFFSDIQRIVKPSGIVISIDKHNKPGPKPFYVMSSRIPKELEKIDCTGIEFLQGVSQDPEILAQVKELIDPDMSVMVSLDAGHTPEEVFIELVNYSPLVTKGSYIVVEDTHLGTIIAKDEIGPTKAIEMFLNTTDNFKSDPHYERFGVSYNHGGWLKKIN